MQTKLCESRVLVLTGAGISAESGIPTFRGAGGHWRHHDVRQLATMAGFRANPELVWDWYRERRHQIRAAEPNAAHIAVTRLATEAREFLLLTQNVDDLHARARWQGIAISPDQRVQIHGDIFVTRCSACAHAEREDVRDAPGVPSCPRCGAALRPGVVWFGEMLPAAEVQRVERFLAAGACDLVVVIGTTALFGYIVDWARQATGRGGCLVEINPDETPLSAHASETIRAPAAQALPDLVARWAAT